VTEPAYPAARAAAEKIYPHFQAHHETSPGDDGRKSAPLPDTETIEAIIDAGFWASLRREEGFTPKISLAFVTPEHVQLPLRFERPIPLSAQPLTRLAPAVERPGIHLGVCRDGDEFRVWGATRHLPAFCFVLEVIAPGLLVIKHSRADESGKFVNVAVLQGEQIKVVDQKASALPDCPDLLTSLLGFDTQYASGESVNVLIQLAVSMRAHGRGGLLLVVPSGSRTWQESFAQPIMYSVVPPFAALAELMQEPRPENPPRRWMDAVRRAVDGIAGLTAVDGATVITTQYEVLAFGAKIIRRRGSPPVLSVIVTEPIEGAAAEVVEPAQLGGTRHLSAVQFGHDQRDSIALVASQDGRFTVFAWSPCEAMVHAHRVESLLL
jgi:hypothetical protein